MMSAPPGITLKEIARRLGLTPRAVSQALHGDGGGTTRVGAKTVAKVRALALEGGYRLNTSARSLRTRQFRQIGILMRYNFKNMTPPMAEMPAIFGLGDYLNSLGWHLVVVQNNGTDPQQGAPHYVREHSLDGVVVSSYGQAADERSATELSESGVPYIWYNNNAPVNAVGLKDTLGGEMATQHLLDLGHKRIVFTSITGTHSSLLEREQGYRNVMQANGLEPVIWKFKNMWAMQNDYRERDLIRNAQVREIAEDLLPNHRPTALVCYSDSEALTVIRAVHGAGLKVPDDVSVIGYNDLPLVDNVFPPLTTVRANFYQLGRMAGEMLMELLEAPSSKIPSRVIFPELVVRDTTGPAPRAPAA